MAYSGPPPMKDAEVLTLMLEGWLFITGTGVKHLGCRLEKDGERKYLGRSTFVRLRDSGLVRYREGAKNRIELTEVGRRRAAAAAGVSA